MHVCKVDKYCFESLKSRELSFFIPHDNEELKENNFVRVQETNETGFTGRYLDGLIKKVIKHKYVLEPYVIIVLACVDYVKYFTTERKKSCGNCIHSLCVTGNFNLDPQEAEELIAECLVLDFNDDLFSEGNEVYCADKCGKYEPVLVENCKNCGNPINKPAFEHEHWCTAESILPCCSSECVDTMDKYYERVSNIQEIGDVIQRLMPLQRNYNALIRRSHSF